MNDPKYPEVNVKLVGEDGNAFSIIGRTVKALRQGGVSAEEIKAYQAEATSGDYNNLLSTTMKWVSCDAHGEDEDGFEDEDEEGEDDE